MKTSKKESNIIKEVSFISELSKEKKQLLWNDFRMLFNGKEVESVPTPYTSVDLKKINITIPNGTKMFHLPAIFFYLKRKDKYFFKNSFGAKFIIETAEKLPLKKGDKFDIKSMN